MLGGDVEMSEEESIGERRWTPAERTRVYRAIVAGYRDGWYGPLVESWMRRAALQFSGERFAALERELDQVRREYAEKGLVRVANGTWVPLDAALGVVPRERRS